MNFHDNKLWQEAYVVLMDVHDALDEATGDQNEKIAEDALVAARNVAAKIADGLSRVDKRFGHDLILDAVGLVAIARTELAIAWGRGLMDDETFRGLDTKYEQLSISLQNSR